MAGCNCPGCIEVRQAEQQAEQNRIDAERYARRDGWNECLDSIRSSIRNYPNQGGDIEVMQGIDKIVSDKLETARKALEWHVEHSGDNKAQVARYALAQIGAVRTGHLRQDKQKFLDDLKSGALENTPSRLALASHISNSPECECDLCGTDAEREGK